LPSPPLHQPRDATHSPLHENPDESGEDHVTNRPPQSPRQQPRPPFRRPPMLMPFLADPGPRYRRNEPKPEPGRVYGWRA
jgi:hypothetical protein